MDIDHIKNIFPDGDSDSDSEGGSSSQGGHQGTGSEGFHYQDPLSVPLRDDLLPPQEIKRLLKVHQEYHEAYVKKQQQTRKERKAFKEGRPSNARSRGNGARYSSYKQHPVLSQKAQFSGIDPQVNTLPNENQAETNVELRDRLENRYQNRLNYTKQFNPKPRPF